MNKLVRIVNKVDAPREVGRAAMYLAHRFVCKYDDENGAAVMTGNGDIMSCFSRDLEDRRDEIHDGIAEIIADVEEIERRMPTFVDL